MKNQNKVREYKGYYFRFENNSLMYRFIELYKDLFINYEFIEYDNDVTLKIICKGGVIPEIRNGLKKNLVVEKHGRYYIKAA